MIWKSFASFGLLFVLWAPGTASASSDENVSESRSALPGIDTLVFARAMRKGVSAVFNAGYGYTESLIEANDSHHRAFWTLGATYRPWTWLAFGLRLDGRYDRHVGLSTGTDDSLVVDPTLALCATHELSERLGVGLLATLWTPPGERSFALVPKAFTPELRLLGTYRTPAVPLLLAANAGFRLDRSGQAVGSASAFSASDRLALGLSDSSVIPIAAGATYDLGPVSILAEWAWELHTGGQAPSASRSPMNVSVGGRFVPSGGSLQVQLLVSADLSRRPSVADEAPLVPIDPRVAVMAGIAFLADPFAAREPAVVAPEPQPPPILGGIEGQVLTLADVPIQEAIVTLEQSGKTSSVASSGEGRFEFDRLPLGRVVLRATAPGHIPLETVFEITSARPLPVTLRLKEALPEGEIRGTIRSFRGQGIPAELTIEPLGQGLTAQADGTFSVVVPPGTYEIVIRAKGFVEQRRSLVVEPQGVTVLNVDLRAN